MRRWWLLAGLLVLVACGGSPGSTPTTEATSTTVEAPTTTVKEPVFIEGIVFYEQPFEVVRETFCLARQGYRGRVMSRTPVTVRDESGTIIAAGQLEEHGTSGGLAEDTGYSACRFRFRVQVSHPANFYTIEVAGQEATYAHSYLEENHWIAQMTIE